MKIRQAPEGLDIAAIWVVVLAATVTAVVAVVAAALLTPRSLLAPGYDRSPDSPVAGLDRGLIGGPARGLEQKRRRREELSEYGWVDPDAGLARIPIDEAMELVAAGVRPHGAGDSAR